MRARLRTLLVLASSVLLLGLAGTAHAATLPAGFQESTAFSGLENPSQVEFSPDGRIFVAEKSGLIKVYDNLNDTSATTFADLRTQVHNFWDRGMLGMALPPNFPASPYVYVLYTHDAAIGGTAPRWGSPGGTSDGCPTPPGATGDGCVVSGRLSRLQASGNQMTGPEQVLIEDWCQQYPSHSVGDLGFGADGALYVTGGDGASFNFTDYGQDGSPLNPCGDPPGGIGAVMTPPSAEGGALRSQDVRTSSAAPTAGSHIIRPNGDVTADWGLENASSVATALADNIVQPTVMDFNTDGFIYDWIEGHVAEVTMANPNLGGATPSAGKLWFFGDAGVGVTIRADVIWGGVVRASTTMDGSASVAEYEWRSVDVVPPNQAAVDDLRVRFTVTKGLPTPTQTADVRAAYFDLQTTGAPTGDPTGLNGAVLRVDPATGAGMPGNPLASSSDPNARRLVAYGLRNPFRFAIRPGTSEVWLGDVGWDTFEEIDRVANPTDGTLDNFGWPCHEGGNRQGGYDSANLSLCESLYSNPSPPGHQLTAPYYAYNHASKVVSSEGCPTGSSSASGVDFYEGGPYPADYDGAMFFSDYSRDCIWAMKASGGLPNPASIVTLVDGATNPVDITVGPDGALYYADFDGGTIRKISFAGAGNQPPTAVATANPTSGAAPLAVQFNGSGSSDPDPGDSLTYAWDLDNDGQYDDSTAANPSRTYQAGTHIVRLRVTDESNATATASVTITAGNSAPQVTITAPTSGTNWQVGSTLGFSATATDSQDGTLAPSRFNWQLNLNHCPSNCHAHLLQTFSGISSGSFVAPDHEYPSHLMLRATATDSGGLTATKEVRLDPRTYALTLSSYNPTGLKLSFNGVVATSAFTRTVIRGSSNSISAPTPQTKGGRTYAFSSWSDGGAQTHNIVATANRTYRATYRRINGVSGLSSCKKKHKGKGRAAKRMRKRCLLAKPPRGG